MWDKADSGQISTALSTKQKKFLQGALGRIEVTSKLYTTYSFHNHIDIVIAWSKDQNGLFVSIFFKSRKIKQNSF